MTVHQYNQYYKENPEERDNVKPKSLELNYCRLYPLFNGFDAVLPHFIYRSTKNIYAKVSSLNKRPMP